MANEYTTLSLVTAELGGATINSSSTPSSTELTVWITEESKNVELMTGRVWTSNAISSTVWEYHDYDGSGSVKLDHFPILSVEAVEFENDGLGAASTTWHSMTEGRTSSGDYVAYLKEGVLKIHNSNTGETPIAGFENIRVAYTHGYSTVPLHIQRLATLMVAKRYILSKANSTAGEEGGSVSVGTISVSDPNNYVHTHMKRIENEIQTLLENSIQSTKFHIYETQLY